MLEPRVNTPCRELPGHDPREEPEDDPDPEHVLCITGNIDGSMEFFKGRDERDVQLVRGVEVDGKRKVHDP